jgi:hypothetical protein
MGIRVKLCEHSNESSHSIKGQLHLLLAYQEQTCSMEGVNFLKHSQHYIEFAKNPLVSINYSLSCGISGSHGGEYEEDSLL